METVRERHEKLRKASKKIRKILKKNNILISNYKGSVFLYDHKIVENECFSIVRRELIEEKALVSEEFGKGGSLRTYKPSSSYEDVPF